MPVPTWRLALVAGLGALAILTLPVGPVDAFAAINAVVLLAAASDWALAPPPRRLSVERELPPVMALGGSGDVVWRVRNPLRWAVRVRLADQLAPSMRPTTRRAHMRIPAGARAAARTRIAPARRGRFTPSAVSLRVDGPLGLVARQATVNVSGVLRVYPPFRSRQEAELRLSRSRVLEAGLRPAQGQGGGTEFDRLREYEVDDEFRRIDWAATARAGKPIVRTYRAERNQIVLVLLDTGRTMAAQVERVPRLDHAMDAVLMTVAVATRLGDRAGMVAFADQVRGIVAPSQRRDQLQRVTEAMYALEPALAESDYRGAFAETLARFRRRALLIVLTELSEHAVAETLLPALPLAVRDHLVVVAGVRDPALTRWAGATPRDASAAYRKAAAVAELDSRRHTVARLRGLGAVVIDAPPGRLAPELADAYLRVKSTGRL